MEATTVVALHGNSPKKQKKESLKEGKNTCRDTGFISGSSDTKVTYWWTPSLSRVYTKQKDHLRNSGNVTRKAQNSLFSNHNPQRVVQIPIIKTADHTPPLLLTYLSFLLHIYMLWSSLVNVAWHDWLAAGPTRSRVLQILLSMKHPPGKPRGKSLSSGCLEVFFDRKWTCGNGGLVSEMLGKEGGVQLEQMQRTVYDGWFGWHPERGWLRA